MEKDILCELQNMLGQMGVLSAPIPLAECRITRKYLLDRCNIPISDGTALMLAVPYLVPDILNADNNLSLYAIPKDYHLFFKQINEELNSYFKDFPDYRFALFADHSPIDEVDAAARAGLGVKGLNGMLITPQYGSFVFLGEIVTNAPVECRGYIPISHSAPECNLCGECMKACPTACLSESRDGCLSALTQKKGKLTDEEITALASHPLVWGCDICQLACPINKQIIAANIGTDIEFFKSDLVPRIDEKILSDMSDEEFSSRAYSWRGRETIIRNLHLNDRCGKDKLCSD